MPPDAQRLVPLTLALSLREREQLSTSRTFRCSGCPLRAVTCRSALSAHPSGKRFSLSQWERAGVRGKSTPAVARHRPRGSELLLEGLFGFEPFIVSSLRLRRKSLTSQLERRRDV